MVSTAFLFWIRLLGYLPHHSAGAQIRNECLAFYNENYLLLLSKPRELLAKIYSIMRKIDNDFVKKTLLSEMNRFDEKKDNAVLPLRATTLKIHSLSLDEILNLIFTVPDKQHVFYSKPLHDENYTSQKIFVAAHDGTILDGLLVQNPKQNSNVVVLALVGHFQNEHSFFNQSYVPFQQLFDSDIVFINHRNYAVRADSSAKNIRELVEDVVQFAKYFHAKGKDLVLYGMCGGAAHMILAATMLTQLKIPYKLIVDRFFIKYSNILDIKTVIRLVWNELRNFPANFWYAAGKFLFSTVLRLFLLPLLYKSNTNINFGAQLQKIPAQNILILQAKSKKRKDYSVPEFTDFFVHPKNDIRIVLKSARHANRMILKKLIKDCQRLVELFSEYKKLKKIFVQLAECFTKCVELIDNEKLKLGFSNGQPVTDLHAYKLFSLTTRNNLPIGQFLKGFFSPPKERCDAALAALTTYSINSIFTILNFYPLSYKIVDMIDVLNDFLILLRSYEVKKGY